MWPCHEIIELIEPRVPGACVRPATWSNIGALARRLPGVFASYYLECRLSSKLDQIDFLACALAPGHAGAARRMSAALELQPDEHARASTWQFTNDVVRRWLAPSLEWSSSVPTVWLEFDHLETRAATQLAPSLCVCTDREYLKTCERAMPWNPADSYARCLDLVTPVVPPELEGLLGADNLRALTTCFQRLPPGGRIIHVSFMVAREPATIKLYGAVPRGQLMRYLEQIEWSGPFDLLGYVVRTFCSSETADDIVYFDLSLEREILPHTAIAFSQLQLRRPNTDPRRTVLLGMLEAEGLCDRPKGEQLRAWPGCDRESRPDGSRQARISRWLDVKLTVQAEQGLGAKGYLGFAPVLSIF